MLIGSNMAFMAGGGGPVTISLTDHAVDSSDSATYTFTSRAIGTASSGRKIVVGIARNSGGAAGAVSSVTIGGISATKITGVNYVSESSAELWQADVPTGTTATIVVVWANSGLRMGIGVWALTNAAASAHDAQTASNGAPGMSVSINCPANGAVLGCASNGGASTWTWTGIAEQYDEGTEGGVRYQSGASSAFATQQTGLSVTASDGSGGSVTMAVCSFGPA